MSTPITNGYAGTGRMEVQYQVANTADITAGDMLCWDGATGQFVTPCGSGDIPCAVALEDAEAGTLDGDNYVKCDVSPNSYFEFSTDAASSVAETLIGKTCDVAGAQSIDIGSSTDDCVYIFAVNVHKKTVTVRFDFDKSFAGVV